MNALLRRGNNNSDKNAANLAAGSNSGAGAGAAADANGQPAAELEKHFGLSNFGNTCYANSVLQALYFCKPFRELLELSAIYYASNAQAESSSAGQSGPSQAQLEEALSKAPGAGQGKSQSERYREAMTGVTIPARTAASGGGATGTGTAILPQQPAQPGEKKPGLLSRKQTTLGPSNTPAVNGAATGEGGDKGATPPSTSGGTTGRKGGLARGLSNAFGGSKRMSMTQVPTATNGSASAPASRPGTAVAQSAEDSGNSGTSPDPPARSATSGFLSALSGQMVSTSAALVGAPVTDYSNTLHTTHTVPTSSSAATTSLPLNLAARPDPNATLFTTLRDLFSVITHQPKQNGVVAPQAFITQLKQENELFRSTMHQDAHEFFNYLMNEISEDVSKREAQIAGRARADSSTIDSNTAASNPAHKDFDHAGTSSESWVQGLFSGILTSETRCLTCETVTSRDEAFLDLSIDIEQNTSVTACLKQFSASEMLCRRNKYSCERCCSLQEAEKRMKIKQSPNVLALHLKRFKYQEDVGRLQKLGYRVVFPFSLRLFNTSSEAPNADRSYRLRAIVVHIGQALHHGHYVALIRSGEKWLLFDDDSVSQLEESEIQKYYGDTPGYGSGYVLFYEAQDLDVQSLLPKQVREGLARTAATAAPKTEAPLASPSSTVQQMPPASPSASKQASLGMPIPAWEKKDPFASPTPVREKANPFDDSRAVATGAQQATMYPATTAASVPQPSPGGYVGPSGLQIERERQQRREEEQARQRQQQQRSRESSVSRSGSSPVRGNSGMPAAFTPLQSPGGGANVSPAGAGSIPQRQPSTSAMQSPPSSQHQQRPSSASASTTSGTGGGGGGGTSINPSLSSLASSTAGKGSAAMHGPGGGRGGAAAVTPSSGGGSKDKEGKSKWWKLGKK